MDEEFRFVYVACSDREEAIRIGRKMVEARLAACANVQGGTATSIYHWEGKIEQSEEVVLVLKTRGALVAKLTEEICDAHSYDVPGVVVLPIISGNPDYLEWLRIEQRRMRVVEWGSKPVQRSPDRFLNACVS